MSLHGAFTIGSMIKTLVIGVKIVSAWRKARKRNWTCSIATWRLPALIAMIYLDDLLHIVAGDRF